VSQALKHPYFKSLHRDGDPGMADCPTQFDFSWEQKEFDEKRIQDLIWEEIYNFRPDLREERQKGIDAGSIRPYEKPRAPEKQPEDGAGSRRDSVAAAAAAAEAAGRADQEERRISMSDGPSLGGPSLASGPAGAPAAAPLAAGAILGDGGLQGDVSVSLPAAAAPA
jgi:hypothetical protein